MDVMIYDRETVSPPGDLWDRLYSPPEYPVPSFRPHHSHLQPALDIPTMADVTDPQVAADLKKKRTFRTFSYRGIELDKLLDLGNEEVGTLTLALTMILVDLALFVAC